MTKNVFKTLTLLLAVLGMTYTSRILGGLTNTAALDTNWQSWKVKYNKTYASDMDENYRKAIFAENLSKIEAHNADSSKHHTMQLNRFADLSSEESSFPDSVKVEHPQAENIFTPEHAQKIHDEKPHLLKGCFGPDCSGYEYGFSWRTTMGSIWADSGL